MRHLLLGSAAMAVHMTGLSSTTALGTGANLDVKRLDDHTVNFGDTTSTSDGFDSGGGGGHATSAGTATTDSDVMNNDLGDDHGTLLIGTEDDGRSAADISAGTSVG